MNYKFDMYGLMRNVLMVIVLIIGIFAHTWDFVNAFILYNIAASLTDISVNLKDKR